MLASEPFFYQSVLLDARRWYTEFYCIPTDRTAFSIRIWPRLVLHVGLRLVFFGGDGVWAKCHSNVNLAMPRLAWFVFCWRRPFVLFNDNDVRSRSKKKKRTDFCGPFPAHGGFVRTPRTPYSYAPGDSSFFSFWHVGKVASETISIHRYQPLSWELPLGLLYCVDSHAKPFHTRTDVSQAHWLFI